MGYAATLPWAETRALTQFNNQSVASPDREKPSEVRDGAMSFSLKVYMHSRQFTATLEGGVRPITAHIILGPGRKNWRIDCVDVESDFSISDSRLSKPIKRAVLERLIIELLERGIDPFTVKGWQCWSYGFRINKQLEEMGICQK